eukprot:6471666-Amphidinium_carterae.1
MTEGVGTLSPARRKRAACLTNEQASVLLDCGEYWSDALIPKAVFLDMLAGLLGLRGELSLSPWKEQLAASCALSEADMVDVRRFVAQSTEEKEGEHPLDAQGVSLQSQMKAWFSSLPCLSSYSLTSMCCSGTSVEEAEHPQRR